MEGFESLSDQSLATNGLGEALGHIIINIKENPVGTLRWNFTPYLWEGERGEGEGGRGEG